MAGHPDHYASDGARRCLREMALVLLMATVWSVGSFSTSVASAAAVTPPHTTSYYERNANPAVLYRQGEQAGKADAQGVVILDFGRPAYLDGTDGTWSYSDAFVSLVSIASAVESYVSAYYRYAPSYATLNVAVGTNNSCGTGQPCGGIICGCPDEPPSFTAWGGEFALSVEQLDAWVTRVKAQNGFSDDVRIVAADDAEPGFDPGFDNTYNLLNSYATTVGGAYPAMVDYGSADPHFWTERQLFKIAYGLRPDIPMPEIYNSSNAAEWVALLRYAKTQHHESVPIYGVLTGGSGTNSPRTAVAEMLHAAANVTDQQSIGWSSTIVH
jgi:hypothetical protein